MAEDLLATLNPAQREAVLAVDGPVLVVAGPGTGKTHTLTTRLTYLIESAAIPPRALLALTFTTRAGQEMARRLEARLGPRARQIALGTFHSLCLQLLRTEGRHLGLPETIAICDSAMQSTLWQQTLKQLNRTESAAGAQRLLQDLSAARNRFEDPRPALTEQGLLDLFEAYRARLRKQGLLDFDDLIACAVELLASHPDVRQRIQSQYSFISVDEYQDVNPLQYRLLRLLGGECPNLWAVGDADQAIYAFRGAQVENFLRFEQDFPSGRIIRLEQCYRCTPQIVAAAGQVIARNTGRLPFVLKTENPAGPRVNVVSLEDADAEALYIVRAIEECVGGTSHYQHYHGEVQDTVSQRQRGFQDFAVLYRLNALARPLEETFAAAGIPYRVVGGTRFFDRPAIKDTLAYLRVLRRPEDNESLSRILNVPPRGIGETTQTALTTRAEEQQRPLHEILRASPHRAVQAFLPVLDALRSRMAAQPLSAFIAELLQTTGLAPWRIEQDPRRENDFLLLRSLAAQHDDTPMPAALDQFLAQAALANDADDYDKHANAVTLMSLHAAKGLEFTEVFLCGLEEDVLPYAGSDIEEERRLFYVGLTRAKERAHLLACRSRFLFGARRDQSISRFLSEFNDDLTESIVVPDRVRRKDPEPDPQMSLL